MALRNNPFKPIINQIPAPFRNKYFLVLILFFGWLIFFDKHDILTQYQLQSTLNELERDKVFYSEKKDNIEKDTEDIEKTKEKFAREHHFMKKPGEDVFIFVTEE